MEIKKISDSQIKMVLTSAELEEKNIDIKDLLRGSSDSRRAIDRLVYEAAQECNIKLEDGSIVGIDIPQADQEQITLMLNIINNDFKHDMENGIIDMINSIMKASSGDVIERPVRKPVKSAFAPTTSKTTKSPTNIVYKFDSLELMANSARYLLKNKITFSQAKVYKYEHKYYLVLEKKTATKSDLVEMLLYEFGEKTKITSLFLTEHGNEIIKENAVKILTAYY